MKVSQVVARELGIDPSLISIKPTNTLTNANGSVTGGSMTSELNCYVSFNRNIAFIMTTNLIIFISCCLGCHQSVSRIEKQNASH